MTIDSSSEPSWEEHRNAWREARRADWKKVCRDFDKFPRVGVMPDGAPIRMLGRWGEGVMEQSGYVCSPTAYSCRQEAFGKSYMVL